MIIKLILSIVNILLCKEMPQISISGKQRPFKKPSNLHVVLLIVDKV